MISFLLYWKALCLNIFLYFGITYFAYIWQENIGVNEQICNTVKSNQLMMVRLTFSMVLQRVWQGDLAFGSIHVILFVILETYLTVSILVFWYLIFCIHLTRKYWCKYTNMQYCDVKPAADDYVTLLYVFLNSVIIPY